MLPSRLDGLCLHGASPARRGAPEMLHLAVRREETMKRSERRREKAPRQGSRCTSDEQRHVRIQSDPKSGRAMHKSDFEEQIRLSQGLGYVCGDCDSDGAGLLLSMLLLIEYLLNLFGIGFHVLEITAGPCHHQSPMGRKRALRCQQKTLSIEVGI